MGYRLYSAREAAVVAALAAGMCPRGGHFELGAADLVDEWMPQSDYMMAALPKVMGYGLKILLRAIDYLWPLLYLRRLTRVTSLSESEVEQMLVRIDRAPFPNPMQLMLVKALMAAFYELPQVRDMLDAPLKFDNHPAYEGLKD